MQCSAVQCSAVQCSAVQCSAVQCSAVQCSAVQCSAVQCRAVQCSAVQSSAVQCSAVQCSAVHIFLVRGKRSCSVDSERNAPFPQQWDGLGRTIYSAYLEKRDSSSVMLAVVDMREMRTLTWGLAAIYTYILVWELYLDLGKWQVIWKCIGRPVETVCDEYLKWYWRIPIQLFLFKFIAFVGLKIFVFEFAFIFSWNRRNSNYYLPFFVNSNIFVLIFVQ